MSEVNRESNLAFSSVNGNKLNDLIMCLDTGINFLHDIVLKLRLKECDIDDYHNFCLKTSTLGTTCNGVGVTMAGLTYFGVAALGPVSAIPIGIGVSTRISNAIYRYFRNKTERKELHSYMDMEIVLRLKQIIDQIGLSATRFQQNGLEGNKALAHAVIRVLENVNDHTLNRLKGGIEPCSSGAALAVAVANPAVLVFVGTVALVYGVKKYRDRPRRLNTNNYSPPQQPRAVPPKPKPAPPKPAPAKITTKSPAKPTTAPSPTTSSTSPKTQVGTKTVASTPKVAEQAKVTQASGPNITAGTTPSFYDRLYAFVSQNTGACMIGLLLGFGVDVALLIREWRTQNPVKVEIQSKIQYLLALAAHFTQARNQLLGLQRAIQLQTKQNDSDDQCICQPVELSVFYVNIQSLNPKQSNKQKMVWLRHHIETLQPDIIAIVETWLISREKTSDEILRNTFGMKGYAVFRHHRATEALDSVERGRRGGGYLVAYNQAAFLRKRFVFGMDKMHSNDWSRFFTLYRYFNCNRCIRTGVTGGILGNSGQKQYCFALHYRRPEAFKRSLRRVFETRDDYNARNNRAMQNLLNYFTSKPFAASVIVGDFNLNERQWCERLAGFQGTGKDWGRVRPGENEYTTRNRTSPDGVLAQPPNFVSFPMLSVFNVNTVHNALVFSLYFGMDFETSLPCRQCL